MEGRGAVSRWAGVLRQTATDLWANNAMEWAAALAFYAVLSLFPLLLAASAVAAYAVEPTWAANRLADLLAGFVPPEVVDADAMVASAVNQRGRVGLLAIVAWVLAGRRILGALVTALDRVSDVDQRRESLLRRAAIEVFLLGVIGTLFAVALSAGPLLDLLWATLGGPGSESPAAQVATAVARLLLVVATFWVLYAVVPHGERGQQATLAGALVAAVLFLVARAAFLAALDRIWQSFDLIYGPLAVAAVLLLWAWYVGLVVLFGGSLASHAKVMLVEGKSAAVAERRHVAHKQPA